MARRKNRTNRVKGRGRKGRRRKKRRILPYIISTMVIALLVAGTFLLVRYRKDIFPPPIPEGKKGMESVGGRGKNKVEGRDVTLYFSDMDGLTLKGEHLFIDRGSIKDEVRELLEDLVKGPKGGVLPTIPEGTRLIGVDIKDGIAYVDFSKELYTRHPGGSAAELQTVYSIVNSIVFNFPEIMGVQILIEGKRRSTLVGHIDISLPLKGDRGFIKG